MSVPYSSVLCRREAYAVGGRDELEEVNLREATMSHREIMVRFNKLFGREMTPKERQTFFMPYGPPLREEQSK